MTGWQVTEKAVKALENMATQLETLDGNIRKETEALKDVYEENKEGLGAHSQDISDLIDELESAQEDASIPVKKLVLKLRRAALIRAKHIQTNVYSKEKGRSR